MELQTAINNGQNHTSNLDYIDDSTCSTPYVSAPSSPGRAAAGPPISGGFFYSAPASPLHFAITAAASPHSSSYFQNPSSSSCSSASEFEFSARFGSTGLAGPGSMSSADELFLNGQIRPMKLSTHLEHPQLLDLEEEEEEEVEEETGVRGRDLRLCAKSVRRRTRSLSPLRNKHSEWTENEDVNENSSKIEEEEEDDDEVGMEKIPSVSASSSRSSSAGRSSKRWVFLKDFLRSKSEGRSNNKFWSTISFSPTKDKKALSQNQGNGSSEMQKTKGDSQGFSKKVAGKPSNGVGKRRVPAASAHELHYKANRAQTEEMRKKTYLPYRQGLLGCLGFSSKSYGAMNGFARALNPVSSR